jgi:hypothetical protein
MEARRLDRRTKRYSGMQVPKTTKPAPFPAMVNVIAPALWEITMVQPYPFQMPCCRIPRSTTPDGRVPW